MISDSFLTVGEKCSLHQKAELVLRWRENAIITKCFSASQNLFGKYAPAFFLFKLKIQQGEGRGGAGDWLHFIFGFYHEDLLLKCLYVYPHGHYSFKDKFSFHSFYYVEQDLWLLLTWNVFRCFICWINFHIKKILNLKWLFLLLKL